MPPFKKEEWITGGTPVVAHMLQRRIFERETEFPVGTVVAYELETFSIEGVTSIARFNGEMWDISGEEEPYRTTDFLRMLRVPSVTKIWLLEDGATIYQRDEKEEF